jgi:hypothetical protein
MKLINVQYAIGILFERLNEIHPETAETNNSTQKKLFHVSYKKHKDALFNKNYENFQ